MASPPTSPSPPVPTRPLRSAFANDADMREVVQMFVGEMPDNVAALSKLWNEQRLDDLRRMAHQLKGAGGGYGFPAVGDAAGNLEASINAMAHGSAAKVDRLRSQFDDLLRLCRAVSV